MSQFPLIKALGLFVQERCLGGKAHVNAADLEALLSKGVRVQAYKGPASRLGGMWILEGQHDADSTHTALLIDVRPIERDTAEGLLFALLGAYEHAVENDDAAVSVEWRNKIVERAKRLLDAKV